MKNYFSSTQFARFRKQLLGDKKRLGLMVLLLSVAILMWGRLLLKNVPKTAMANPKNTPNASADVSSVSDVTSRPVVYLDLPQDLNRDLFLFSAHQFSKTPDKSSIHSSNQKSSPEPADTNQRASQARDEASSFTLQTTMMSQPPRAMINGQILTLGETINGFTVTQITQRHVTLERDGIQVRLSM